MKQNHFLFWLVWVMLLTACAGQKKIIFRPDPIQDQPQERNDPAETWQIIESQGGSGESGIPPWVRFYLNGDIRDIESLDTYSGKYVFVGENRGDNFSGLQQWANGFSIAQDLPRLIAQRVERRLTDSAALYPDDEYGGYFANMIKKAADGEYAGCVREQTFWVKKKVTQRIDGEDPETPPEYIVFDRYEFFILISIDKEVLQQKIQGMMASIKTSESPTREQAAAVKKINQTFFENF